MNDLYYGKSSSSKIAIAKQRAVSRKIMASIDYQKNKEDERENRRIKSEINAYWLKKMIKLVEEAFICEPNVIDTLHEKVFLKWKKYKYNRDFYLAHTDIYRELEGYPQEYKNRVEQIVCSLRKEREQFEKTHK